MARLEHRAAGCTTEGRRTANEDAVLVAQLPTGAELVAVADGMGGHAGGAVASRRALEVLHTAVMENVPLPDAVRRANAAVFAESVSHSEYRGMGTTLVAALRQGDEYTIVNVGDSRAYRLDRLGITQVTRDNSFVAEAVQSGRMSMEEAQRSRWRTAVTRSIGTDPETQVDEYGPYDAREPHTLLLCSDGAYRFLSAANMRQVIRAAGGAEAAADALTRAAYDAGSDDNISVAVISFGSSVWRTPPGTQSEHPLIVYQRRRRGPLQRALRVAAFAFIVAAIAVVTYILWGALSS